MSSVDFICVTLYYILGSKDLKIIILWSISRDVLDFKSGSTNRYFVCLLCFEMPPHRITNKRRLANIRAR